MEYKNSVPATLDGSISSEQVMHYFSPRSDLTYRKLEDLVITGADIYQSLLTGSLIRNCIFTKVIFSRSDLDGLRIEGSTFRECDFSNCDIRSSVFAHCEFQQCTFGMALIDDCEFKECEFAACSFKNALLKHCRFHGCSLSACSMTPGSFLHNRLYNSKISDMVLGDCTLLYVILRNCTLERVSINAESIGAIVGLTREQLSEAGMVYLGKEQPVPPDADVISLVADEYRARKWYIGQLVLAINFGLSSTFGAFDRYLSLSFSRFVELGFAKGDELEFLGDLLQELAALDRLPLLSTLDVLEWCSSLEVAIRSDKEGQSNSSTDSLRALAGRVSLLANTLIEKLDLSFAGIEMGVGERQLCIKAEFHEKPTLSFPELLNSISAASGLPIAEKSCLVRAEWGSYLEIVYTTLSTVLAFKVFLFLVNGCIIQLTEMKYRLQVLARKRPPKGYKETILSPSQPASPAVLSVLQGLAKYAKKLTWLTDPALSGYTSGNIKSLQELECDNVTER